ncbi:QueT transporter family protein [Papillibacter cinnamivorans]|uniref:Uncharacterized membrane protein n=1 Tax=Papillibacter cinnamivorans DSM 12816 TaxID=1122930 RepID=A0A1W2BJP4_9FIRM|nr:QueT transporter family protein [Papillibacter cinnamivorans]SMC73103.1 Uncharacterized membrane protein [Papillibacter cinnamivorans DSM 12816]
MKNMTTKQLVMAAVVGAAYVVLTMAVYPIAFGPLQCRISEALTVLPYYFPQTMWGLFVGCLLSNYLGGATPIDIIFGSLATLAAGYLTSKIRSRWLAPLPPVVLNGVVVGATLAYVTAPDNFWPAFAMIGFQVAVGELIACYALGLPILYRIPKIRFLGEMITAKKDGEAG